MSQRGVSSGRTQRRRRRHRLGHRRPQRHRPDPPCRQILRTHQRRRARNHLRPGGLHAVQGHDPGSGGFPPAHASGQVRRRRTPGADPRRQGGHGTRPGPAGYLRRPGTRQLHRQYAGRPVYPGRCQVRRAHPAGGRGAAHPRRARGHRHRLAAPGAPGLEGLRRASAHQRRALRAGRPTHFRSGHRAGHHRPGTGPKPAPPGRRGHGLRPTDQHRRHPGPGGNGRRHRPAGQGIPHPPGTGRRDRRGRRQAARDGRREQRAGGSGPVQHRSRPQRRAPGSGNPGRGPGCPRPPGIRPPQHAGRGAPDLSGR